MASSGPDAGKRNQRTTAAGSAKPRKASPETQLLGRMRPARRMRPMRIGRKIAVTNNEALSVLKVSMG